MSAASSFRELGLRQEFLLNFPLVLLLLLLEGFDVSHHDLIVGHLLGAIAVVFVDPMVVALVHVIVLGILCAEATIRDGS